MALALAAETLAAQPRAEVAVESRFFRDAVPLADRLSYELTVAVAAEFHHRWDRGRGSLSFQPYARWDPSGARTRIDIKELSWGYLWDRWELRIGVRETFWGVSESQHLVDVINQRDLTVGGTGYVKMGQPMVNLTAVRGWGTVDFYLMPVFRERTFSGRAGLLWSPLPVYAQRPVYESSARRWHLDWAVRWSHTIGDWDVGLHHFAGTRREPRFVAGADETGRAVLVPHYDLVDQTGIDVQWTTGAWLWKLEALTVDRRSGRYVAAVGGLEYAFADYLSLFAEYLYDSRASQATTSFADDLFVGARLFLQDGHVEGGAFVDRETFNSALSIAFTRRLGEAATLSLEACTYLGDESLEPAHAPRRHRYLSVGLRRYF